MADIIPLDPELANYNFEVELNLKNYKFKVEYVARCDFWVISLFDSENNLIAEGVPQTNYPLFFNCSNDNKPAGDFWVIDTSGKNQDITRDNLGKDIILIFESNINVS